MVAEARGTKGKSHRFLLLASDGGATLWFVFEIDTVDERIAGLLLHAAIIGRFWGFAGIRLR
jgi:hypothetical protein